MNAPATPSFEWGVDECRNTQDVYFRGIYILYARRFLTLVYTCMHFSVPVAVNV